MKAKIISMMALSLGIAYPAAAEGPSGGAPQKNMSYYGSNHEEKSQESFDRHIAEMEQRFKDEKELEGKIFKDQWDFRAKMMDKKIQFEKEEFAKKKSFFATLGSSTPEARREAEYKFRREEEDRRHGFQQSQGDEYHAFQEAEYKVRKDFWEAHKPHS